MIYRILIICLILSTHSVYARGVYQKPSAFIQGVFTVSPEPQVIWIKGELRSQIENILQHKYKAKRVRYWREKNKSAWVLDEIGKKKPITVGIVIDSNKISHLKVLAFRESRGWEVRYPFFTKQFNQLFLTKDNQLSESVDGISGATLSVRALRKLARIALLLNHKTQSTSPQK
ncbi:hypothetical protein MNBD_GAMMA07-1290 [hydrothermal vent metagenome]|uniref:FMN-binding domain-containing protein n=1 Tax=hydrothermal vent metagenome TaxID=652676 RepID=A0A3B0X1K2_9ZZZZ